MTISVWICAPKLTVIVSQVSGNSWTLTYFIFLRLFILPRRENLKNSKLKECRFSLAIERKVVNVDKFKWL
jgi:hypothetical protein